MKSAKIEAILPLNFLQRALLFHSLLGQKDQGFLHVTSTFKGVLNKDFFQKSLNEIVRRHEVLRTSIHWKEIKSPLQVVHPSGTIKCIFEDWTDLDSKVQNQKLIEFREADEKKGLDLSKKPVTRIVIFQLKSEEYLMLWTCHHILLDGWSASNIIKDLFAYYDGWSRGEAVKLNPIPKYKDYLKELDGFDFSASQSFWSETMADFNSPTLINNETTNVLDRKPNREKESVILDAPNFQILKKLARQNRVTLNSLIQGLWALLLAKLAHQHDVVFGTTVSIRSDKLNNAEEMAGLFVNMIPVRVQVKEDIHLFEWLKTIQQQQLQIRNHHYVSLDQIISWMNWPGFKPLFDTLLVVENFPWKNIQSGGIEVIDFEGGITSTYPLTIMVKPLEELEFTLLYDTNLVGKESIDWILKNIMVQFTEIIRNGDLKVSSLLEQISPPTFTNKEKEPKVSMEINSLNFRSDYLPPENKLELELTKIWEEIFGFSPIGVNDNFFEIGGKSILAVQLFAQIERKLGYNLSPITLLQHTSIKAISTIIKSDSAVLHWKSLVPINIQGEKPPLFCLHAKGGHVFFYNALAKHLGDDQPVYALQPKGLDGVEPLYESIEEMATHYLTEIKTIQPNGPYALLATCFSNAVGLEMAQQLHNQGEKVSILAMVDASPGILQEHIPDPLPKWKRVVQVLKKDGLESTGKKVIQKLENSFKKKSDEKKSKQELALIKVQEKLDFIFRKYRRKAYEGKVTLIRSSEFEERSDKVFHVEEWEEISTQPLEIIVVPGHHQSLFLEPEVIGLAKGLAQCLPK